MSLKVFRDMLLDAVNPEDLLRLADEYLQDMERKGEHFILPREHAVVKPVLEHYAGDLAGWVKFVKSVRDRLPVDGRVYHAGVQPFYRTLVVRLTQVQRRERLDAAVDLAVRKGLISDEYEAKMRYARRCTQVWKQRRDQLLKSHSDSTGKGRLSIEEREELLTEFWGQIAEELKNGEIPKP